MIDDVLAGSCFFVLIIPMKSICERIANRHSRTRATSSPNRFSSAVVETDDFGRGGFLITQFFGKRFVEEADGGDGRVVAVFVGQYLQDVEGV